METDRKFVVRANEMEEQVPLSLIRGIRTRRFTLPASPIKLGCHV